MSGILYIIQRFISQHYSVDLSAAPEETNAGQGGVGDNGDDCDGSDIAVRRRSLSLREAIDELTQLRVVRYIYIRVVLTHILLCQCMVGEGCN